MFGASYQPSFTELPTLTSAIVFATKEKSAVRKLLPLKFSGPCHMRPEGIVQCTDVLIFYVYFYIYVCVYMINPQIVLAQLIS